MPDSDLSSHEATGATPGVAVIIPFYNGAAYIERALRSIYAQSVPAAEVVIVNDGSTPEESAFLRQIQSRYGFTLIDQENGGQGAARNAGVAATRAPYVCFLDQDDFYLEHHNRILIEAIPPDEPRWGFVYGNLWEASGQGDIVHHAMIQASDEHPKQDLFDILRKDLFVLPSAMLIRRAAFEAVGGFDTQFTGYEDDDLCLRLFRAGYTSHFVEKAVTVWCMHSGNTTFGMRMNRSCLRYFKKLAAAFPDEPRRNRYYLRDCLVPRFGHHFIGLAIRAAQVGDENLPELRAILDEYAAIVLAHPTVRPRAKLKLRAAVLLAHHGAPWMISLLDTLTQLPGMGRLRRRLLA
jgi:GT2 family glycosyltransferase